MGKQRDKKIVRLLSKPKDYTYSELKQVLGILGYKELNKGKTSGSRVAFSNEEKRVIRTHKPHPDDHVKGYVLDEVVKALRENGDL